MADDKKKRKFRLADLFFEDDEISKQKKQAPQNKDKTLNTTSSVSKKTTPTSSVSTTGTVDKKIYESLIDAIENSNLEGFDYFEYKESIAAMKETIADEATRFKAAYASATAMGISKERLLETAQFYISVLDKEEKDFLTALKSRLKGGLENDEKELNGIDDTIKSKSEEITKLTKEIDTLRTKKESLTKRVSEGKIKVEAAKNNFYVTQNMLKDKIKNDMGKMKSYLK